MDNPQLVEGLIHRAIPTLQRDAIATLAAQIDLRNDFYLVIKDERLCLDWEYMSMYNLHKFFEKLKTVTTRSNTKTSESRALEAGMQSLHCYFEQDLAELVGADSVRSPSADVAIAELKARARGPWLQDQSLLAIWKDGRRSTGIVDQLLKQIVDIASKPTARFHHRANHLMEFLRRNGMSLDHTPTTITMEVLIETLHHTIQDVAAGWQLVKTYANPKLRQAMSMTSAEFTNAWVSAGVIAKSESRRHERKRKTDHRDGPGSFASSERRPNPGTKDRSHRPPKPTPSPKDGHTESQLDAPCVHCGTRHNSQLAAKPGWECAFVRYRHPHVNHDKNKSFADTTWGQHYARHPWKDPKTGEPRTSLSYDLLCNEQGGYDKFQLRKDDSKSTLVPFLNNISNINGHDDLNPFMSLTVLTSNLLNREETIDERTLKKLTRAGVTTSSGLIDSGAVDSDYISSALFKRISDELGYTLDRQSIDVVATPFAHLPDIKCKGRVILNVAIFNELSKRHEIVTLKARVIDSPIDIIIGRPTIRRFNLLYKCHDQILSDTRITRIENSPTSGNEFLENDLWLQLNLISGIAEINANGTSDVPTFPPAGSSVTVNRWNPIG